MNWKEKNLYDRVKKHFSCLENYIPSCNDFLIYLFYVSEIDKFKYFSVVQYDDINDIYVHDTHICDIDFEMFAYNFFPVYKIMILSDTVILQIDICDY